MELLQSTGSIITCSSGTSSNCAISVIRLSGFKDVKSILKYTNIKKFKARYAHFCKLIFNNQVIDEVIAIYYPAPNSFTGENILELNVHGNRLNVERIINLFIEEEGFKSALPGEFTYRALKNKKLNLAQVEGLDLLLNANSGFILNQGFSLLSGSLQDDYLNLHDAYLKHLSSIEMSIDFMEDVGEENANKLLDDSHKDLEKIIESLFKKINRQNSSILKPKLFYLVTLTRVSLVYLICF
jgi:tRNA modification GTPase